MKRYVDDAILADLQKKMVVLTGPRQVGKTTLSPPSCTLLPCTPSFNLAVPPVPAVMPGPRAWAAIVAIAVLCSGIAYILYFRLIAHAGPSRALAVTFMAPVFAVFYGAVFLGEPVTAWMLGCAAVIVGGTLLSTGLIRRPAKAAQGVERP